MSIIILISSFTASSVKAQQAKAYETVVYTAKAGDLLIRLYYADGYTPASKVKVISKNHTLKFNADGEPDANGDLTFTSIKAPKQMVTLHRINEEEEAPRTINATYRVNSRNVDFKFSQK